MRLLGTRLLVLAALSAACLIQPAAAQPAAAAPAAKSDAEPIYHETSYPEGNGPFPVIVALHTSSGFKSVQHQIAKYDDFLPGKFLYYLFYFIDIHLLSINAK